MGRTFFIALATLALAAFTLAAQAEARGRHGGSGSHGGPGYRKADGKCASWRD